MKKNSSSFLVAEEQVIHAYFSTLEEAVMYAEEGGLDGATICEVVRAWVAEPPDGPTYRAEELPLSELG